MDILRIISWAPLRILGICQIFVGRILAMLGMPSMARATIRPSADVEAQSRLPHSTLTPTSHELQHVTGVSSHGHKSNNFDSSTADFALDGFLNTSIEHEYSDMDALENREEHERFMREAIKMGELALKSDETPVGCVFVHNGEVIGRGMNDTNKSMNGTRHAEFVGLAEIMSKHPPSILSETDLYVTVEPCIMCASALRQLKIRGVYFGCFNDRFGGTGGVLKIHSDPSIDPPYPAYGGIFREEAIMLLRRFYIQENDKAPEPKQKRNRELKTEILPLDKSKAVLASASSSKENVKPVVPNVGTQLARIKPVIPLPPKQPIEQVTAKMQAATIGGASS